jgi:hypothetical protein
MDVYLVPIGSDRYELYFEVEHDDAPVVATEGATSWWRRRLDQFRVMLAEAERDRLLKERGIDSGKSGIGRWIMSKIAEVVAEQRLLWHLRNEDAGRLLHPHDVESARAIEIARANLSADFKKHRRWAVIDTLLAIILGPLLFFVPGPNIVAYYFLFRGVGHYLSMRGAQQGIERVQWQAEAAPSLTDVRLALTLPRGERRAQLDHIAHALGLSHLAAFVERVAARPS